MIRLLLPLGAAAVVLALSGAAVASTAETASTVEIASGALHPTLALSSGTSGPVLTVTGTKPFVVRGTRFVRNERVRVSFLAGRDAAIRTVQTTPAGTFSLTTPQALAYDPCSTTLVIVAKGTNGDLGTVRRPARGCAPA